MTAMIPQGLPTFRRRFVLGCWMSLLVLSLLILNPQEANAQISGMWASTDGDKISSKGAQSLNWHGTPKLRLFGMRNETLALQLFVRTGQRSVENLQVLLPKLGPLQGPPHIEVFRQDMVQVRQASKGLVWKAGSASAPSLPLGGIADRLRPNPRPLSLGANQVQGFWIDLWIPRDANAGIYKGTLQLSSSTPCDSQCSIPLELEILDRTMPDKPAVATMLWFSGADLDYNGVFQRYGVKEEAAQENLRDQHFQLLWRHRITLISGKEDSLTPSLLARLTGTLFSSERGYRGPGENLGQDLLILKMYGGTIGKKEAKIWQSALGEIGTGVRPLLYAMDEPSPEDFEEANRRITDSLPIPALLTTTFNLKLKAQVFVTPAELFAKEDQIEAASAGKALWIYNGRRPFTGSFAIDDVGTSPRVNSWIQYLYGIPRWFYWESTYYDDFQGERGPIDIGAEALNFRNRHGDAVNGDGLLVYPGRDVLFEASDAGYDGPMPSIRLKNWRRGIEDVAYLQMARDSGFEKEVAELMDVMLPKVLDKASDGNEVSWPESGKSWELARRYLFELLRDGHSDVDWQGLAKVTSSHNGYFKTVATWKLLLGFLFVCLIAFLGLRRFSTGR